MKELRRQQKLVLFCISFVKMLATLHLPLTWLIAMVLSQPIPKQNFYYFNMTIAFCCNVVSPFDTGIIIIVEQCGMSGILDWIAALSPLTNLGTAHNDRSVLLLSGKR
jgi:hypothetical protein